MSKPFKDYRILMLFLSFVPFTLWVGGAIVVWQFWSTLSLRTAGVVLFGGGFFVISKLPKIAGFLFRSAYGSILENVDEKDWLGLDLEKTGTQGKLHMLPQMTGVMILESNQIRFVLLDGTEVSVPPSAKFTKVNKGNVSLAVQVTDENEQDLLGYVFQPQYRGSDMEVVGYADKQFEWFNKWLEQHSFYTEVPPLPVSEPED